MTGIDLLRRAARIFDNCNESFNTRFNASELLLLARACCGSDWDILPDSWEEQQVQQAIHLGLPPAWKEDARGRLVAVYP